jgi:hypothetical protein
VLACFEDALRHRKLGAVVAEVAHLSMTASRRLQLAAEGSGVIGLALRRWRRQSNATEFRQPTAACAGVSARCCPRLCRCQSRPRTLAARTHPLPRRRKCRVRSGGLRRAGASRPRTRPGRPRKLVDRLNLVRRLTRTNSVGGSLPIQPHGRITLTCCNFIFSNQNEYGQS